jgi:hypothetical protein
MNRRAAICISISRNEDMRICILSFEGQIVEKIRCCVLHAVVNKYGYGFSPNCKKKKYILDTKVTRDLVRVRRKNHNISGLLRGWDF